MNLLSVIRTHAIIMLVFHTVPVHGIFGFALSDLVRLQQMGFGLAFAAFLNTTMRLLGDWNRYLPFWLS